MSDSPRVLILPGWQNSGPEHWQSRWELLYGDQRVEQDDWLWPRRGDWMAQLDEALLAEERPALLVAHSLGCHLVAGWAEHSQHAGRIVGALLVAPPDVEREDLPPQLHNWRQPRLGRLPFPTIAVVSSDDPYSSLERSTALVTGWGATVVHAGPRGHLNSESGLGDWPEGRSLLDRLLR